MVPATRYDTTTHDTRSTLPSEAAIAGRAVETMVWSTTARNIGSMMDGKTVRNRRPAGSLGSTSSFMRVSGPSVGLVYLKFEIL